MGRSVGSPEDEERECDLQTKRLYNRLRLWAALAFGGVLIGLTLLSALDHFLFGGTYAGPPVWLTTMVGGILVALFGSGAISNVLRRK